MAGEGVFPKSAGDVAYASEANRFYNSPHTFFIGSTQSINSGTSFQVNGSVLIEAGSMTNPMSFHIDFYHTGAGTANRRFKISGLSTNATVEGTAQAGDPHLGTVNIVVGSPANGTMWFWEARADNNNTDSTRDNAQPDNLDTTQDLVIFFESQTNGANAEYRHIVFTGAPTN